MLNEVALLHPFPPQLRYFRLVAPHFVRNVVEALDADVFVQARRPLLPTVRCPLLHSAPAALHMQGNLSANHLPHMLP